MSAANTMRVPPLSSPHLARQKREPIPRQVQLVQRREVAQRIGELVQEVLGQVQRVPSTSSHKSAPPVNPPPLPENDNSGE